MRERLIKKIIMDNHDWMIKCIKAYGLDLDEVYGDVAVEVCQYLNDLINLTEPDINAQVKACIRYTCKTLRAKMQRVPTYYATEPVVVNWTDELDLRVALNQALNELPEVYRFVAVERSKGSTFTEIGRALDISRTNARNKYDKALQLLRYSLREVESLEAPMEVLYFKRG